MNTTYPYVATPHYPQPVAYAPASPAPYGYPAPVPQPAKSNVGKIVGTITGVVVTVGVILAVIGFHHRMGTAYKVTSVETVYYSGNATEADAKKLGDELKTLGYFNNTKGKDVLIRRDDTGTTISFVVGDNWNQPEIIKAFQEGGKDLSKLFGQSTRVKLIDENLSDLKEIPVG